MYCKNCGREIADGSAFCSYCGAAQTAEKKNNYDIACMYFEKAYTSVSAGDTAAAAQLLRTGIDCLTRYILNDCAGYDGDVQLLDRINIIAEHGIISQEEADVFHAIRKAGNTSVHEGSTAVSAAELYDYIATVNTVATYLTFTEIPQIRNNTLNIELDDRLYNERLEYLREYCEGTLNALKSSSTSELGPNFRLMVETLCSAALMGYRFEGNPSPEEMLGYIRTNHIYNDNSVDLLEHSLVLLRAGNKTYYRQYAEAVLRDIPNMFDSASAFYDKKPKTIYADNSAHGMKALGLYSVVWFLGFLLVLFGGGAVIFLGYILVGETTFAQGIELEFFMIAAILICRFFLVGILDNNPEYFELIPPFMQILLKLR